MKKSFFVNVCFFLSCFGEKQKTLENQELTSFQEDFHNPHIPLFGLFFPTEKFTVPPELRSSQEPAIDLNHFNPKLLLEQFETSPKIGSYFLEALRIRKAGINALVFLEPLITEDLLLKLYALQKVGVHNIIWIQNLFKFNLSGWKTKPNGAVALPCVDYTNKGYIDIRILEERTKLIEIYKIYFQALSPFISFYMLDDHIAFNFYKKGLDSCLKQDEAEQTLDIFVKEFVTSIKDTSPNLKSIMAHHPLAFAKKFFAANWDRWEFNIKMIQGYIESSFSEYEEALENGLDGLLLPLGRSYERFSYCGAVKKGMELKKHKKSVLFFRTLSDAQTDELLKPFFGKNCLEKD
jgi:hypothetical protein